MRGPESISTLFSWNKGQGLADLPTLDSPFIVIYNVYECKQSCHKIADELTSLN